MLKALDLFCGAGGATRGLQLAGFHVTGVDLAPQPRYCGDAFHQADAMTFPLDGFDFIWASPPCQRYSTTRGMHSKEHQDLVALVRERLLDTGADWCIENVEGAPLRRAVQLCGLMFGLKVIRHRRFEASRLLLAPNHPRHPKNLGLYQLRASGSGSKKMGAGRDGFVCVVGKDFPVGPARLAMGIPWMTGRELSQAIPPAYSRYIAEQLVSSRPAAGPAQKGGAA